ncbi:ATPase [Segetibacter sp. 3557_3]|uniref:SRPBCC domain-containing protein n=1 Tax=Segetibacter sp. 3557_3 TaxID=2547429 RepID=UPI001058FD07|nr:SRPBCC domain-containing protein [Segetibacter sp. 3557_3]TDH28608.1 ATPase [Segetibacter sp. 3557_3]
MTTNNQTRITAEPGKQELFIEREFDAPRDSVFKAFSTPEILLQFFAPAGVTMHFNTADYRVGGSYNYTFTMQDGSAFTSFGFFHEMSAPERIIQTFEFEGMPEQGHAVLEILTFDSLPGERTRLTIQDICRSVADRNAMVESGMESGLVIIFKQLDELLKSADH